jgi:pimeloyl-ACP methyl ester carboxylesterase
MAALPEVRQSAPASPVPPALLPTAAFRTGGRCPRSRRGQSALYAGRLCSWARSVVPRSLRPLGESDRERRCQVDNGHRVRRVFGPFVGGSSRIPSWQAFGAVPRFRSWDRTELAYRVVGSGSPLVCIPGGPGQAVEYFDDLGGLSHRHTLILLDNRGTGALQTPHDHTTFRVDRLVEDVEALRRHLGLDQMDLFGHSASGGICLLYAARHSERVRHLVLVDPSLRVVGMQSDLGVDEVLARRAHEPWYADAVDALHAEAASLQELEWLRRRSAPLLYGRWNAAARKQAAAEPGQFAQAALDGFYAGFEVDPTLPRRLATLTAPVLLVVGEYDIWPTSAAVRELANLLHNTELAVLPRAGHFPWVDDPDTFAATLHGFLAAP